MGIYTGRSYGYTTTYVSESYENVVPFNGDNFNYHELGVIAAAETASNMVAFEREIMLGELLL